MACDLGIIGGGQLASMMIEACENLHVKIAVLGKTSDEPALKLASVAVIGDYLDPKAITAFADEAPVLTFDLENIETSTLVTLEREGKKIFPSAKLLTLIQDKHTQKEFFFKHGFPTAPLVEDPRAFPYILKARRGGYDGKGVWKISNESMIPNLPTDNTYRETVANLDKELSVIVARGQSGDVEVYPVVEMVVHAQANMLDYLICPAQISEDVAKRAQTLAKNVAEKMNVVGILAVEMFLLKSGELWINEVAPRPHNSGHFTIEACQTSQFENHVRAALGLPLGSAQLKSPAFMFNIVGEEGHAGAAHYEGLENLQSKHNVFVHLYGKRDTKPFRKMGHVTVLCDNFKDIQSLFVLKSQMRCATASK